MFIWLSGPRSIATYSGIRHIVIIIIAMGGVLPHDGGGPGLLVSHTSTGFRHRGTTNRTVVVHTAYKIRRF
jgi:hypothetical protein